MDMADGWGELRRQRRGGRGEDAETEGGRKRESDLNRQLLIL
jgi:hypothetical protein